MKSKLLNEAHGQRTYVAILETGDKVTECLERLADAEGLDAAQVSAIGAVAQATLAYWDWDTKSYQDIPVHEQCEVLALTGDIAMGEAGKPKLHLHAVLGRRDGSTRGGHLLDAEVRPTLEVLMTESPAHLRRKVDRATGLALIALDPGGE